MAEAGWALDPAELVGLVTSEESYDLRIPEGRLEATANAAMEEIETLARAIMEIYPSDLPDDLTDLIRAGFQVPPVNDRG
jgi:hypothetical protein